MTSKEKQAASVEVSGARVEVGTFTFEGKDFSAMGSVIDPKRGILTGYATKRKPEVPGSRWYLATWGGAEIAPLRLTGTWRIRHDVWGRVDMTSWACDLDGRTYIGRHCADDGSLLFMRAGKGRAE